MTTNMTDYPFQKLPSSHSNGTSLVSKIVVGALTGARNAVAPEHELLDVVKSTQTSKHIEAKNYHSCYLQGVC